MARKHYQYKCTIIQANIYVCISSRERQARNVTSDLLGSSHSLFEQMQHLVGHGESHHTGHPNSKTCYLAKNTATRGGGRRR